MRSMKTLLRLMGVVTLSTVAASSIVACGQNQNSRVVLPEELKKIIIETLSEYTKNKFISFTKQEVDFSKTILQEFLNLFKVKFIELISDKHSSQDNWNIEQLKLNFWVDTGVNSWRNKEFKAKTLKEIGQTGNTGAVYLIINYGDKSVPELFQKMFKYKIL